MANGEQRPAPPLGASNSNGHDELLVEEIASLAFKSWNQAGRPPGQLAEFWRRAEQHIELLVEEIACVAFESWNQMGRPAGRLAEFWRKAEQQIPATLKAKAGPNGSSRRLERKPAQRRLRNLLRGPSV
ncbi:MAG TPA: DUF2934 domain-containing protein [Verrucomicrobiae bacterium]|jgi:hypothetical protein